MATADRITEFREDVSDGLHHFQSALGKINLSMWASVYSVIGIAFFMALIAAVLPPHIASIGMVAMFVLGIPVSGIYWIRYAREEELRDKLDELLEQERIVELEQAITERLDVLVRNA